MWLIKQVVILILKTVVAAWMTQPRKPALIRWMLAQELLVNEEKMALRLAMAESMWATQQESPVMLRG